MTLVNSSLYCSKAEVRVPVVCGVVVVGGVVGGANRFSCLTHDQVALDCFWVGLVLLGLALRL